MSIILFIILLILIHGYFGQNPNYKPSNLLPDPLIFINGSQVKTLHDWNERRNELKQLMDYYILGTKPAYPSIISYKQINSTTANEAISTYFSFNVNVSNSEAIYIEFICPLNKYLNNNKNKQFSLILSQYDHREWLIRAVQRRIFCGLRTPTSDGYDLSQQFKSLYSNKYSWGVIRRRAWLNSIILNFVINNNETNNMNINYKQIGIFGHSRNGKQSLITAAFDDRIGVVIGSSSGMPISSPFRYTARDYFGETVYTDIINGWWADRIQLFYGKENECPADGNFIISLIAPRSVMLANAINDEDADNPFANDKNYLANHNIFYNFPYKTRNGTLTVQHRFGTHHGFIQIETYIDYFQFAFNLTIQSMTNNYFNENYNQFKNPLIINNFNWNHWNESFYEYINHTQPNKNENIMNKISWLIGSDAVNKMGGGYSIGSDHSEESRANNNYIIDMMGATTLINGKQKQQLSGLLGVTQYSISYGGYISADVYYPSDSVNNKDITIKPIIYLHPYSYSPGYIPNYVGDMPFYYHFASLGYGVITLHQIGFGERQYEGLYFYNRFGSFDQCKLGHMVMNVRLLIDVIECSTIEARNNPNNYPHCQVFTAWDLQINNIPNFDMNELTVVGYAMGGQVAIHAAALDKRIKNVASIAGFTPFRNNSNNLPNAGNYYFYQTHGLIPKLGYFKDNEENIPYDYHELFQIIAPRKILLYAPQMDKNAHYQSTKECIINSQTYWNNSNAQKNYSMQFPNIVTDFSFTQFSAIQDWLKS